MVVQPLLFATDLVVLLRADDREVRVLDSVSLALAPGAIADITGPSGSGKTTLLRALARLLPEVTGSLTLDSVPAEQIAPSSWRASVALLPQKPAIFSGSVAENLRLPWTLKVRHGQTGPTDDALRDALLGVELTDVDLKRDAARLSVGQQARVALLRVLLTNPRVLLLDEPDAALDDASSDAVGARLREFADAGGAIARVRHHRSDGLATERYLLTGGALTAIAAGVPEPEFVHGSHGGLAPAAPASAAPAPAASAALPPEEVPS